MVGPLMIEKEEERTVTMQMKTPQWHLRAMRRQLPEMQILGRFHLGSEQPQEKQMTQHEAMNRPVEVQAAHCHHQQFRE